MIQKHSVQFKDEVGERLEVILEKNNDGRWETYVRHSQDGRGASKSHGDQRAAVREWKRLEDVAFKAGWRLRTVVKQDRSSTAGVMKIDPYTGRRLFKDRRTGEWFEDQSSERPPSVTLAPPPGRHVDAFDVLTLPRPRRL